MSSTATVSASMLEFLRWVDARPRTYTETMEAWRTSCPRFSIWEDASIDGYVVLRDEAGEQCVFLTRKGARHLEG
jgi:hypothetical protein